MRKRTYDIHIRLSGDERTKLDACARSCGVSQSDYVRSLIGGFVPRASPPETFYELTKELHSIGNNLNQIAWKANSVGAIDSKDYSDNARALSEAILRIESAVLDPVPLEKANKANDASDDVRALRNALKQFVDVAEAARSLLEADGRQSRAAEREPNQTTGEPSIDVAESESPRCEREDADPFVDEDFF